ncbi:hypothetical protein E0Z10_g5637 [Xylaria hypoxylon]|uniref:Uncharacterized protein n=1 Tax=Xylaria hypoxylon TaxID=37992 RepID=A0A4Z0YXF9_9PEZI|nr:hypothetical protein E0Z10_g5637 [Xylaria hypoxylon]
MREEFEQFGRRVQRRLEQVNQQIEQPRRETGFPPGLAPQHLETLYHHNQILPFGGISSNTPHFHLDSPLQPDMVATRDALDRMLGAIHGGPLEEFITPPYNPSNRYTVVFAHIPRPFRVEREEEESGEGGNPEDEGEDEDEDEEDDDEDDEDDEDDDEDEDDESRIAFTHAPSYSGQIYLDFNDGWTFDTE